MQIEEHEKIDQKTYAGDYTVADSPSGIGGVDKTNKNNFIFESIVPIVKRLEHEYDLTDKSSQGKFKLYHGIGEIAYPIARYKYEDGFKKSRGWRMLPSFIPSLSPFEMRITNIDRNFIELSYDFSFYNPKGKIQIFFLGLYL